MSNGCLEPPTKRIIASPYSFLFANAAPRALRRIYRGYTRSIDPGQNVLSAPIFLLSSTSSLLVQRTRKNAPRSMMSTVFLCLREARFLPLCCPIVSCCLCCVPSSACASLLKRYDGYTGLALRNRCPYHLHGLGGFLVQNACLGLS